MTDYYDELSQRRKKAQSEGLYPEWYTTAGYSLFEQKYRYQSSGFKEQAQRIAKTAAKHLGKYAEEYEQKFFDLIWKGWLSCSTPVLSNMGTTRGMPVSCEGGYVEDSIDGFYSALHEQAVLSKHGFGTSVYLGDVRGRGEPIAVGGKASGVIPVLKNFVQMSRDVSQGCYDKETELLTEKGWKTFPQLLEDKSKGNVYRVAQVSSEGVVSFVEPLDYMEYEYSGNMISFKDSKNIDLLVTPNHNMTSIPRRRVSNKRGVNGKHLSNVKTIAKRSVHCRADETNCHRDNYMLHSGFAAGNNGLSFWERFLIASQADGHIVERCRTALTFRFKKDRKKERLVQILEALKLKYTYSFYENEKVHAFYVNVGKEVSKDFSWVDISSVSDQWAEDFIQECFLWDGSVISQTGGQYFSSIEENADSVMSVASLAGYKVKKSVDNRVGDTTRNPLYILTLSKGNKFGTESVVKTEIPFNGKVFCVEVPEHNLIVRRNGHNVVCGNSNRRGAIASYLPIDHKDFWEVVEYLEHEPDDLNIGWNISDAFIARLNAGDEDAVKRFKRVMRVKMVTGRGYFFFVDKVNRKRPEAYVKNNLDVKASNLCNEITLHSSKDYSFTCVLSSLNLAKYNEWKDTDAIFTATVFLDCVASEFIERSEGIRGLEKARAFTIKGRALGLGVCGFATYLQQNMMPYESFEAHLFNSLVFAQINEQSRKASEWLAREFGEPDWCSGLGIRNTHRIAIAPTKPPAFLMGGFSGGITPAPAMTYTQAGAGGEMQRINPILLSLMKKKGVDGKKYVQEVIDARGSVQGVSWLTDEEKLVFRTAFEIDQHTVIRLASGRAKHLDQWQSLNLFFSAEDDPAYIAAVHRQAFEDEAILGLYYCYSMAGVVASRGECIACQ